MISEPLSSTEQRILQTIRENKPMTIKELKEKLYDFSSPDKEFFHDLNYLIVYRKILKTTIQGKKSLLIEKHQRIGRPNPEQIISNLCSTCPVHQIATKEESK